MKLRTNVVLLTALIAASAAAQDVSVYSTTIVQSYKENIPGFDQSRLTPATEFLGIDANKLGADGISFHFFGWAHRDFNESTLPEGNLGTGDLTYGYLEYRSGTGNGQVKLGRFGVNVTGTNEMVDGVSAGIDLKGGFTVSAFAGEPVLFKPLDPTQATSYHVQRDMIFGGRLGWRMFKGSEIGVSFLQDGSNKHKDLPAGVNDRYDRRLMGYDILIAPTPVFDFSGRTSVDLSRRDPLPDTANSSKIAEHDYSATLRPGGGVSITGNFIERNFLAYYSGSTLPNLFNPLEPGKFKAYSGTVTWSATTAFSVVADFKHTKRDTYGSANRAGADLRYMFGERKLLAGIGYHNVSADNVQIVDKYAKAFGISHGETRAWIMAERERLSAEFDLIYINYKDKTNPNLNGKSSEVEAIAGLGYQVAHSVKISGDVTYGANPMATKEVMGLLRAEIRFSNGGGK